MEDLNCSKMTAVSLLKELQAIGLVDIEQRNGLANIIYVKNFVSGGEEALDRSENCTGKKKEPVKDDQSNNQTRIIMILTIQILVRLIISVYQVSIWITLSVLRGWIRWMRLQHTWNLFVRISTTIL